MKFIPLLSFSAGHTPVGVEVHALDVLGVLAQEAQVLAGARPAQQAEGVLLPGGDDQINAPVPPLTCPEVAKDVIKPAPHSLLCDKACSTSTGLSLYQSKRCSPFPFGISFLRPTGVKYSS